MKEGALHELPGGWVWTRLEDASKEFIGGGTPSRQIPEYFGGNIIWLTPTEVPKNKIVILMDSKGKITESGLKHSSARIIPKDAVLLTSRASIGYVAIAGCDVTTNQGFASFVCSDAIYNFFLAYWLWANKRLLESNATGTTFKEISKSKLREFYLPLPPLPEQRAMVSKIEQLFSDLDNGIENFKKAQAQLKLYRQSVLKAACEGKLVPTEAELARAEGRDYEAVDVLLGRILKERREKWNGKDKYKEAAAPDMSEQPELPEGWRWATLEQLSWDSGYGTSEKCDYNFSGPPVLRIPNINEGRINLNNIKYASESTNLNVTESLVYGDMLVIRTNGSKDLIGRAGAVTQNFNKPYFFASYLIRFRIVEFGGLPIWLSSIWHTLRIRSWIESFAATSAGQYNISMSTLNKLPLELPPLAEQRRIVAEVERRLSLCDKMEATITESLQKAESLRQSILKKAFEGKLLNKKELEKARKAPDWEPAEKLLERIKAEKMILKTKNKDKK